LKEPGTTAEVELQLTARGMTADEFVAGETLGLKVKKRSIDIFKDRQRSTVLAGIIDNAEVVKCINKALDNGDTVQVNFLRGQDKTARILFKASSPVFKAEKQDVRPYIKSGSLSDEDEDEESEVETLE